MAREIVETDGRPTAEREADHGRTLVGRFRSRRHDLATEWRFSIAPGRAARLDVRALTDPP